MDDDEVQGATADVSREDLVALAAEVVGAALSLGGVVTGRAAEADLPVRSVRPALDELAQVAFEALRACRSFGRSAPEPEWAGAFARSLRGCLAALDAVHATIRDGDLLAALDEASTDLWGARAAVEDMLK